MCNDFGMAISIARPSVASLLLQPEVNGLALGTATGFVVRRDGSAYLATNRHVVRGRDQNTDAPLHPSGGLPARCESFNAAGQLGRWLDKEALYNDDGRPLWFEHPVYRGKVDVVALPLTHLEGSRSIPTTRGRPFMSPSRRPTH